MATRLRKIATGAAVLAGVLVLSATPANARPVVDDYVYEYDLGPDKSDWFCTYQVSVDAVTCAWSPGNGESSGKHLVEQPETSWWDIFSWRW